jgi:subtilase family serine protease
MKKQTYSGLRLALLAAAASIASVSQAAAEAPRLVTQAIDDAQTISLPGNTRPEATAKFDRGAVADGFALNHMQLLLKRPAETDAALDRLITLLHDRSSPLYQHWLTAEQFGAQFGAADADISAVTAWLTGHGFTVNSVSVGRTTIDFSGTAGQVRDAFHTEIHNLDVNGVHHIANMSDPRIPAALHGLVEGIVSLHDFRPHTYMTPKSQYTYTDDGQTLQALVPADLATIYNLNPLFKAGISGKGQTIVVIEDTDVYDTANWTTFRKTFGLSTYTDGKFTTVHPKPSKGSNNCADPGVNDAEGEAILDAEWSSASAPNATIELASCADTSTTFGGLLALQNLLEAKTAPTIVSISYGECETLNGATANAAYNSAYKEAVTLGTSVFVAAGDDGAAICNGHGANATYGIGVSGFASTPYNVAVGGTDFSDTYSNTASTYWSSKNTKYYGSALSYIPEIPWNDSCASELIYKYLGYSTAYGTKGACNNANIENSFLITTTAGSGGPSGCATGKPSVSGVVGGTCKGYAKPSWQKLVGNPADKVRDIPDVSLFAANGVWNHYLVFCDTDGGATCTGAPSGWDGAGGTSFASPILAGIQALVDEKQGKTQGNPNVVYYKLAATEYGTKGDSKCNSSLGNKVESTCIFYDVTLGDMDVNCTGKYDCYLPSGKYGVLSTSDTKFLKAYGTTTGWDFSTGIGTLNAYNLVEKW